MAIIKQYTSKNRSGTRHLGDNGVALAFSPDGIVIGDEVVDTATFHPLQNKSASALKALVNSSLIQRGTMISDSPSVSMPHYWGESDVLQADKTYYYQDIIQTQNLDNDVRLGSGSAIKFQDATGKTHWLVDVGPFNTAQAWGYPKVIIVQGESLLEPEVTYAAQLAIPAASTDLRLSASGGLLDNIQVMAVDAPNKQIFFNVCSRNTGNYHYAGDSVFVADFTTVPEDGTLSVSDLRAMSGIPYVGFRAVRVMRREFDFFCGFSTAGEPIFMMHSEVDYPTYTSNTDVYHRWYGGSYRAFKDSAFHRVIFYKYSKATNSCTTLADLQGSDGWGAGSPDYSASGYSGPTRLSGWIDSPIAGEDSIKYCYQMTNDRVSGWTTTGMRYKWDTSDDTFEVTPITFDMTGSGVTTLTELLLHPSSTSFMGTGTDDYHAGVCIMSCFFTEDGAGNYFLSFATQFGGVVSLGLASANTGGNIVSFQLDKTDMVSCTYLAHSKVDFMRAVPTNAKGDTLLAIHAGSAKVWSWTAGGFAESLSAPGNFFEVTQRDDGNIWGVSLSERDSFSGGTSLTVAGDAVNTFGVSVELLSLDIPNSVSVSFESGALSYNGVNITENLVVNAYDTSGSRIVASVTLKLSGATATFQANGLTELTLNTSDAADTLTPITITGAGFINVSASFAI